jgi:hypothetical protein
LAEETGLVIKQWLEAPPFKETYEFERQGEPIHKEVIYFLAEVSGDVSLQQGEIRAGKWVLAENVEALITYEGCRQIFRDVLRHL